jgi:anionic cell wall polymer biosynthesis LytR-Cps2A-Psr (LCP) family protein
VLVACLAVLGVVLVVEIAPVGAAGECFVEERAARRMGGAPSPCDALPCDETQRTNVLLLGLGWNPEEGLTDTILFASFEVDARRALFVSVPRDLSVPFPDGESRKINEAYRIAAARRGHGWSVRGGGRRRRPRAASSVSRSSTSQASQRLSMTCTAFQLRSIMPSPTSFFRMRPSTWAGNGSPGNER